MSCFHLNFVIFLFQNKIEILSHSIELYFALDRNFTFFFNFFFQRSHFLSRLNENGGGTVQNPTMMDENVSLLLLKKLLNRNRCERSWHFRRMNWTPLCWTSSSSGKRFPLLYFSVLLFHVLQKLSAIMAQQKYIFQSKSKSNPFCITHLK